MIKEFCEESIDAFEQIIVYRKNKQIDIWVNLYFLRDFVKALKYCLGFSAFDDGGIECSLQEDTLYIGHFENVLDYFEIKGYQKFIQCMKNRLEIIFYD